MINWKNRILEAFISHYFTSVPETGVLRIRSSVFFPDFHTVHPDEKVSYLEAAESLKRKGLVQLRWERHGEGEYLKTLSCENFESLFEEAGRTYPKTEAEKTRTMLGSRLEALRELPGITGGKSGDTVKKIISLFEFLCIHFGPREIGQGIDFKTMEEFVRLLEYLFHAAQIEKITTRALSILLYRDSKHLENLLALCSPLLSRAEKVISLPDLSFLERSYPDVLIAGDIFFIFKNTGNQQRFFNRDAHILGFPLETVKNIDSIGYTPGKNKHCVLTIENKETFYALARPQNSVASEALSLFDCFLYTGGYPNRAATAMIQRLAVSDFTFYHAGDLDPDGILILQNITDTAKRPVTPVRMDAATFDEYCPWARSLTKPMLRQIKKITEETRAIPGLDDLLRRIKETSLGVEQEIVDYR